MRELREWIDLVSGIRLIERPVREIAPMMLPESKQRNGSTTVRVYHGSPEPVLHLKHGLLYGVRDFGFAASYPFGRSGAKRGYVHTLDFHFQKLANDETVQEIADRLGVEFDTCAVNIPDRNHPLDCDGYEAIDSELHRLGYDGVTGYDFGFRSDFEELLVWAVFDAARQATLVDTVEVTIDDLHRTHEPPEPQA